MDNKHLKKRLEELLAYAEKNGFNSVDNAIRLLPDNDPVAAIGFLANYMGISPHLAFDTKAPLEGEE